MKKQIPLPGQKQRLVYNTKAEAERAVLQLSGMRRGDWLVEVCFQEDGKCYTMPLKAPIRLSRDAIEAINTRPEFLNAVAEGIMSQNSVLSYPCYNEEDEENNGER